MEIIRPIKLGLMAFVKFVFSCAGSILMIIVYTLFGGVMFRFIEKNQEHVGKIKAKGIFNVTVSKLITHILECSSANTTLNTNQVSGILMEHTANVNILRNNDGWNGSLLDDDDSWSLEGSILFSLTVITTIGYGVATPKTSIGKFLTIIYAVFGIPFAFLSLSNIGEHLSKTFCGVYLLVRKWLSKKANILKESKKEVVTTNKIPKKQNENKVRKTVGRVHYKEKRILRDRIPLVNWSDIDSQLMIYSLSSYRSNVVEIKSDDETERTMWEKWINRDYTTTLSYLTYEKSSPEDVKDLEPPVIPYSQVRIPLFISLLIMFVYIMIGAVTFAIWEEKDYLKWAYFSFITLSTIGFGDIVPGTTVDSNNPKEKLIIVALYVIVGLSVFSMCFKLMEEELRYKWGLFVNKLRRKA